MTASAIVREEEKSFIFVKLSDKLSAKIKEKQEERIEFKKVEIITGVSDANFVEVKLLNSLPKNEEIAANGAYYLLAEMDKGETEHGH